MALTTPPTRPNRNTQTQAEFSANAETWTEWVADLANELISTSATYLLNVSGSSGDSITVGTGSKTFDIETGLGFVTGMNVVLANSAADYMNGVVDSYNSGTGSITVNFTANTGSGTYSAWVLSLSAVGASNASDITTTSYGTLSGTTIEAQVRELEDDKTLKLNVTSKSSQAQAEAGLNDTQYMTPLTTSQAVSALVADAVFTETFTSSNQTITSGGLLTVAHGLSVNPFMVFFYLVNTTAENGYSIGDKLLVSSNGDDTATARAVSIGWDATNINVRYGSQTVSLFVTVNKSNGNRIALTNANWALVVKAIA